MVSISLNLICEFELFLNAMLRDRKIKCMLITSCSISNVIKYPGKGEKNFLLKANTIEVVTKSYQKKIVQLYV